MAGQRVHAVRHRFCLTRVREGRVTPQEAVDIEMPERPTIGDMLMNRPLLALSVAAALALAGCRDNPNADLDAHEAVVAKRAAGAADTGGSRKGDFGPPQGEMIEA